MEVKTAIVKEGMIALLIELVACENRTIVRQASQTLKSLCVVHEFRAMAIDGNVFESLTAAIKQIRDKDSLAAITEAIGATTLITLSHV